MNRNTMGCDNPSSSGFSHTASPWQPNSPQCRSSALIFKTPCRPVLQFVNHIQALSSSMAPSFPQFSLLYLCYQPIPSHYNALADFSSSELQLFNHGSFFSHFPQNLFICYLIHSTDAFHPASHVSNAQRSCLEGSAMHTNFNIIIDLSNYNDVIAIVKCGFNLLDQDQLTNLNVNQNVFNIVNAFIKPTFRFTRLYSN